METGLEDREEACSAASLSEEDGVGVWASRASRAEEAEGMMVSCSWALRDFMSSSSEESGWMVTS